MISLAKNRVKKLIYGDHLPVHILSESPLILVSYFVDCYNNLEAVASQIEARYPDTPVYFFFQLGYHVETDRRIREVRTQYQEVATRMPYAQLCYLTNSPDEVRNLQRYDIDAFFAHQNAFLDERRYPALATPKSYDAIYLARFTPAKRHYLAEKVQSLKLIGDHMAAEQAYYDESLRVLQHADLERKVYSFQVAKALSAAHVGLCLSAEEGAMFVSAEYLLSGIPVVTTANLGGRNHLMPDEFYIEVPDDAEAVANAVETLKQESFEPNEIRTATIQRMRWHRAQFADRINEIRAGYGLSETSDQFPHKLCLRMRVPFSLRKQML